MENRKEIKQKILDATNAICIERYGISLYEICGINESDADAVKGLLISNSIQEIKSMGVSTFIASIPRLADSLINSISYRSKDRALRRLYDSKTILSIIDKLNTLIDKDATSVNETEVHTIADKLAQYAIDLAEQIN